MNAYKTKSSSNEQNIIDLFSRELKSSTEYSKDKDPTYPKIENLSSLKHFEDYIEILLKSSEKNIAQPSDYSYNIYKDGHKYIIKDSKNDNVVDSNYSFGDDSMDKLLEKYIEKVDRDQSDLRNDIRASEERIAKNIELSEARNEERLKRMENMINSYIENIDNKIEKIDNKLDRFEDKIDNNTKHIRNISITTIAGIAALVVSVLLATWNLISSLIEFKVQ